MVKYMRQIRNKMNEIKNRNTIAAARKYGAVYIFILGIFMFTSCDYNRRTTGWEYGRDMAHSPAYESYTPNPNFADGKTMQPPVEGTIPRGMVPYAFRKIL